MNISKCDKAITSYVFALLAVVFAGYDLIEITPKSLGFLFGLGGGIISVALDVANRLPGRLSVRLLSMVLSPLGVFVLFPFSLQFGVGYFIGSGITSCMGIAIQNLQKNKNLEGDPACTPTNTPR